jgi:glycosyltransferase involved in cell wall biosynthesis
MTDLDQEYNYTPLAKPLRITEHNWPDCTVPLVSIRCVTYNHVHFIRDAIEGFLMQETTFPVEILIHDDASTDGTADIVREYEAKYPQLIRPIYQTENQYSQGNKASQIMRALQRGKYIAVCEGDDYWADPKKLQIQVSYLEAHPECVISGHDHTIIDEVGKRGSLSWSRCIHIKNYTAQELQESGWAEFMPLTWVHRNLFSIEPIPERKHIKNGDNITISLLGQYGGSNYHAEISPACYRHHQGGIWSMQPSDVKHDDMINTYFWIYRYYKRVGNVSLATHWKIKWLRVVMSDIKANFLITELLRRLFRKFPTWVRGILGEDRVRLIKKKLQLY